MKNKIFALLTILSLTLLTACGQKDDLYIPEDPEAIAAAAALAEAEEQAEAQAKEETQDTTTSE